MKNKILILLAITLMGCAGPIPVYNDCGTNCAPPGYTDYCKRHPDNVECGGEK